MIDLIIFEGTFWAIVKHFPALEVDWFVIYLFFLLLKAITRIIHFYRCLLDLVIM